jgi:predicted transposase/invertase (TIGR01784 family)
MRTDTIFYQLFSLYHSLLFELLNQPIENAEGYEFISVEVKEKAFRFDGIFFPPAQDQSKPIYFVEVQFQKKPDFYWDLIAEISMYMQQYKPKQQWKVIAIFAKRSHDPGKLAQFEEMFESGRIMRIYLDELAQQEISSLGIGIVQLVVAKPKDAVNLVKNFVATAKVDEEALKLIETVLVYKFPKLSRQEIEAMFTISDLKKTKVYQEAKQEGRQEGRQEGWQEGRQEGEHQKAKSLVLRQLTRRFGKLNSRLTNTVEKLEITQLDELAEALLDFTDVADLESWLKK